MKSVRPEGPGKTTFLNIRDIDPHLRAVYKSECAKRGRSMKGMFVALLSDLTKPEEDRVVDFGKLSRRYKEVR